MAWFDYQIAVGWNNAAGLTNIEGITPSGDVAFPPPIGRPNYNPGLAKIRADGTVYRSGRAQHLWNMGTLTYVQYAHARTTWCAGGYSGKVTIRTRFVTSTYANFSATLTLPTPDQLTAVGLSYQGVVFTFAIIVAL